jgi:hypothetical protein
MRTPMKTMTGKCESCPAITLFSREGTVTESPRGGVGSDCQFAQAVRNDSELHPMSLDSVKTVKPSRCIDGQGRRDRTKIEEDIAPRSGVRDHFNSGRRSGQRHGGVSGGGMSVNGMETSGEIPANAQRVTPGTSSLSNEVMGVCREVGAARSSEEAPVMGVGKGAAVGLMCAREAKDR